MANNLTSKEIISWKNSLDKTISVKLVSSLKATNEIAIKLQKVTESGVDGNNLSYRFKDLASVSKQAAAKLNTFMKNFDADLTTYINTLQSAEARASEQLRKSIDQFAEAAEKISKITM